jgi:hypothetical protein
MPAISIFGLGLDQQQAGIAMQGASFATYWRAPTPSFGAASDTVATTVKAVRFRSGIRERAHCESPQDFVAADVASARAPEEENSSPRLDPGAARRMNDLPSNNVCMVGEPKTREQAISLIPEEGRSDGPRVGANGAAIVRLVFPLVYAARMGRRLAATLKSRVGLRWLLGAGHSLDSGGGRLRRRDDLDHCELQQWVGGKQRGQ